MPWNHWTSCSSWSWTAMRSQLFRLRSSRVLARALRSSDSLSATTGWILSTVERSLDMGNLRLESLNLQGNRLTRLDFLIDPCSLSFTLGAFVKVRDNPINCDCDVYSAIVTEYTHVDGKCTEPRKYSQFWLNPSIDSSFRDEAAVECTDTNVTAVVNCERDGIDSSVGLLSSLTVTLFSSLVSFLCVMTGL